MLDCFLRKSNERVGVDAISLFTRFGGRPLEHNSSKTNDNKGDKQTGAGNGDLRKAAVKTTWGRERISG